MSIAAHDIGIRKIGGIRPAEHAAPDIYPDLIDAVGMEKHYRFNETSGTAAADRLAVGGDGTIVNGVELGISPLVSSSDGGKSFGFDGLAVTPGHVIIPDLITGSATFSIDIVVQQDRAAGTGNAKMVLLALGNGLTDGHFSLEINGNEFRTFSRQGGLFNVFETTGGQVPAAGTAYKLTFVQISDAVSGGRFIYRNGGLVGSETTVKVFTAPPAGNWFVGVYTNLAGPFDGLLAELATKPAALVQTQIEALDAANDVAWLASFNAGNVTESTARVIDFNPHAHPAAGYSVTEQQPALSGSSTADTGEDVTFTAGSTLGDGSFTATITSNGVESPSATITVAVTAAASGTALLGSWPLSETSGTTFADATGGNNASLAVPTWIDQSTHELDRPGIVVGSDHALEVSNGGPVIPMVAAYQQGAMSLVMYVDPHGELRGCQYWDETAEPWGREYLAFCDDGSTPGSFAIYRRRNGAGGLSGISGTKQWRLGGYVRDSGGTAQYFGGSLTGLSGSLLPVGTAKRVVLTMSASTGAALYLDGSLASTLPAVTVGWTALTQAISIGSSQDDGYIHDRSPFWGRVDQIEVWQGALTQPAVQALAAATTTRRWRPPSDFVGGTTDINVAAHSYNLQAAINAAHAAGNRYVYQSEGDMTLCLTTQNNSSPIAMRNACRGLIGVRMQRIPGNATAAPRMIVIGTGGTVPGGQITSGFGDPYASTGGYKVWGCYFDGVARLQSWAAIAVPGNDYRGFNPLSTQFSHCIQSGADANISISVQYCEFYDNIGDGISLSERTRCTSRSNRFYGCYRGPFIYNDLVDIVLDNARCEMHNDGRVAGSRVDNGCGLCDFEPFQPTTSTRCRHTMRDCWAESDWDDRTYQRNPHKSQAHYYSCHTLAGSLALMPYRPINDGGSSDPTREPTDSVIVQRCTIAYWHPGGPDGGNFPVEQLRGYAPGTSGLGAQFDHVVFLASGAPQCYHNQGLLDPADDPNKLARMIYTASPVTGRIMTWKNIQVRSRRLPAGLTQANTQCLIANASLGTARIVEIDGMEIGAEFAALPFNWGGMTIRHRACIHEGTGNTKPWSNAGAEVAI